MRISRLVMVVAAGCFAAGSLIEAQGRGHVPAGHAPQIPKAATGGPNVGGGNKGGGKSGNAGVTPGDSSKSRGNPGTAPGTAGDRGGNEAGGGRGNAGAERGNAGSPPGNARDGHGHVAGEGRGYAAEGRGNEGKAPAENPGGNARRGGRDEAENDQDARGPGRGRGNSDSERGATFAKMNPKLRARLESMLPSGMTLEQAADGFRNKGQFIAALQQSQKHDVSFADLKGQMTGDNPISLGAAMRKLRVAAHED